MSSQKTITIMSGLVQPRPYFAEFTLEQANVFLTLPQEIRGAGCVQKSGGWWKRNAGAERNKEVRCLRIASRATDLSVSSGRLGVVVKGKGFDTILKQDLHVRKEFTECVAK